MLIATQVSPPLEVIDCEIETALKLGHYFKDSTRHKSMVVTRRRIVDLSAAIADYIDVAEMSQLMSLPPSRLLELSKKYRCDYSRGGVREATLHRLQDLLKLFPDENKQ